MSKREARRKAVTERAAFEHRESSVLRKAFKGAATCEDVAALLKGAPAGSGILNMIVEYVVGDWINLGGGWRRKKGSDSLCVRDRLCDRLCRCQFRTPGATRVAAGILLGAARVERCGPSSYRGTDGKATHEVPSSAAPSLRRRRPRARMRRRPRRMGSAAEGDCEGAGRSRTEAEDRPQEASAPAVNVEYHAAMAKLEALFKPQWQTMETAPKDGTSVLVCADGCVQEARFHAEDDGWWYADYDSTDYRDLRLFPTCWQPLPAPPDPTPRPELVQTGVDYE